MQPAQIEQHRPRSITSSPAWRTAIPQKTHPRPIRSIEETTSVEGSIPEESTRLRDQETGRTRSRLERYNTTTGGDWSSGCARISRIGSRRRSRTHPQNTRTIGSLSSLAVRSAPQGEYSSARREFVNGHSVLAHRHAIPPTSVGATIPCFETTPLEHHEPRRRLARSSSAQQCTQLCPSHGCDRVRRRIPFISEKIDRRPAVVDQPSQRRCRAPPRAVVRALRSGREVEAASTTSAVCGRRDRPRSSGSTVCGHAGPAHGPPGGPGRGRPRDTSRGSSTRSSARSALDIARLPRSSATDLYQSVRILIEYGPRRA